MIPAPRGIALVLFLTVLAVVGPGGAGPAGQAASPARPPSPASQAAARAAERIQALQKEADALASQERSLVVDLRRLEIERDLKMARVREVDIRMAVLAREMAATAGQVAALQAAIDAARPALEARMVEAYKLGKPGYVRLLFGVDSLKDMARASRLVAAMARTHERQVADFSAKMRRLDAARASQGRQAGELRALQAEAREASAQAERAAAARADLVRQIDGRRDLNAQLTAELETARQRLTTTVASLTLPSTGDPTVLPIRPFRGALAWPAPGRLSARFGQQRDRRFGTTTVKNGIEVATTDAAPVSAVHEGRVAFAGPFTGFGQLVIVDHGGLAYSLYGYLSTLSVIKGARVSSGQRVGIAGQAPAGNAAVYFELRIDGKPVDPLQWLKAK